MHCAETTGLRSIFLLSAYPYTLVFDLPSLPSVCIEISVLLKLCCLIIVQLNLL